MPNLVEKQLAGRLLVLTSKEVTDSISNFSTWLLAGYGAAFSLLAAQIGKSPQTLPAHSLRWAMGLLLAAFLLAIVVRFLFAQVAASARAYEGVPALMKSAGPDANLDIDVFVSEYARGLPPGLRNLARRQMAKSKAGDIAAGARLIARLSQISVALTLVQMMLGFAAAAVILATV